MPPLRRSAEARGPLDHDPFVSALVLAAGASTRMGRPKLVISIDGVPMLRRVVEAALESECREVVIVLGADEDVYRPLLEGLGVRIVHNPDYENGMSTSIRTGIESLSAESEAVIILLADQPWITPQVIDRLIETYKSEGKRIVASAYLRVVGVPVLFDGALYLELLTLEGDAGARAVIEAYPKEGVAVTLPDDQARDIDTPANLEG